VKDAACPLSTVGGGGIRGGHLGCAAHGHAEGAARAVEVEERGGGVQRDPRGLRPDLRRKRASCVKETVSFVRDSPVGNGRCSSVQVTLEGTAARDAGVHGRLHASCRDTPRGGFARSREGGTRRVHLVREGGTRRVHLVRKGGTRRVHLEREGATRSAPRASALGERRGWSRGKGRGKWHLARAWDRETRLREHSHALRLAACDPHARGPEATRPGSCRERVARRAARGAAPPRAHLHEHSLETEAPLVGCLREGRGVSD
jgi:hypothetical protein